VNDPFAALATELTRAHDEHPEASIRLDFDRAARTGIPEFINGEHKSAADVVTAIQRLVARNGRALTTRLSGEHAAVISGLLSGMDVEFHDDARILIAAAPDSGITRTGGRVGVISAGTSDHPVAREAQLIAEEMGCETNLVMDVGVAGLHRLVAPLRDLMAWSPDVLVAAAGMDGALPSVVAGLVDVPVIGLPVSTGYGLGGDGTAALYSMLQSCAPGLTAVNIDNGVGAGSTAALIANRVALNRRTE
jgi:NCAIR mutase (PurE)-related protein